MNATDILNKISKLYNECNYYSDTGKIQFYSSSSSCLEVRSPVSFKTQYHKPYQFSLIWSQDGCTDSISSDGKSVFKKDFDMNEPERIDAKGRIERKIT